MFTPTDNKNIVILQSDSSGIIAYDKENDDFLLVRGGKVVYRAGVSEVKADMAEQVRLGEVEDKYNEYEKDEEAMRDNHVPDDG